MNLSLSPATIALAPAVQQVEWLRAGELSPLELTEIYLDRIETLDGELGSYFHVAAAAAIAAATQTTEQLTLARSAGALSDLPYLFGIPVSIKDLAAVAGMPQSYGVSALRDRIAEGDDGAVAQIKRSGSIILGKTALSQLASWPYSEPPGFLPSRSPWNRDYTSGGSSGGGAAAVAAGLCSLAQGSDGGGSIRGPAFCCGVVGIKPSRGRVSQAPLGETLGGCASKGPLGRTVADAAALLDAMAGYLPGDPYWLPAPEPCFRLTAQRAAQQATQQATLPSALQIALQIDQQAAQKTPQPCRVAFATDLPGFPPAAPDCRAAVERVLPLLNQGGASVEAIALDITPLIDAFKLLWLSEVAAAGIPEPLLEPMNQWLLAQAPSGADYIQARHQLGSLARSLVAQLLPYDALLLPTYLAPPIAVGAWTHLAPEQVLQNIIDWVAPCPLANVTGQPAIALPTHLTPDGRPVGVQIVGQPGADSTVIAMAAWLEAQLQFPSLAEGAIAAKP